MKRMHLYIKQKQYEFLKDKYSNVSLGIREALDELEKAKDIEEYSVELEKIVNDLNELKVWLESYSSNMYLEEYISYLSYYSLNRGFILPSRTVYTEDPSLLEREKELYNSMKESNLIRYKDRKFVALKNRINLKDYKYPTNDLADERYKIDLLVRSYDYRSVFLFLSKGKGKIKLRTWNDYFIRKLSFKENGDVITITIIINENQKPEIAKIE
ncbi:MAG: hypothetical protein GX752_08310 [Clostridium sp.]|jgi:hypothetical protein|nr:hypothetical protein [Clostridium sp.]